MNQFKNQTKFNIKDIIKVLPHRYPFILIDKVKIIELGRNLVATKNVTINEPFFQGHFPNQPVLTADGVIGKTIESGETASIVQLITDVNYRISVRILPSGATGILRWIGNGRGQVKEVQKNVKINIGDKVITSGFSDIYPAGLPVGKVSSVYDARGNYQKDVIVDLPTDLSAFQYAFIITDRLYEIE